MTRAGLLAWSTGVTAAGALGIVVLAGLAVGSTARDVADEEARMAASLWELTGGGTASVMELLGNRGSVQPDPSAGRDGVPAYRRGSVEPSVRIVAAPPPLDERYPLGAGALALAGIFLVAVVARREAARGPSGFTKTLGALAVAVPIAVAAVAGSWASSRHRSLSEHRLSQAARAVTLALGEVDDVGGAARVAGVPWARTSDLAAGTEQWTMSQPVARALGRAPADATEVRVDGAAYHASAAGPVRLAALGYEDADSPVIPLAATALATALAALLTLVLVPLADHPKALHTTLTGWAFLAPSALHLVLFTFGPLLFSLWLSLHDWTLVDEAHPFVGLAQYRALLADGGWWSAIWNTVVFTLHVPVAMAVALGLALLTQGSDRVMRWARMALFLPSVTSIAAIAVVWKWLLNDGYGLANRILLAWGLEPVSWLTSPDVALISLMMIGVWLVVGYQMVVFQAGLASIPRDWYDAARIDGAGPWRRFWHITLPGLRRTLFFVLVTSVIGSFQVFGLVYVMTEGGPLGATDVAVFHIYREAWEFLQFGNAAAMSWMFFVVVFGATWLHFRLLDRGASHA